MIKKILKSAVILLSAGIIATPAMAAEWGVSGQVRVDWEVSKTIEQKGTINNGRLGSDDGGGVKRAPAGVLVQGGDSWVSFDLKGDGGSASFLYYGSGRQEYVGSGSGSAGSWTASAKVSVRNEANTDTALNNIRAGNVVEGTKAGDQTVQIKHDNGFYFKLGLTTPLDTFRQGRDYLLIEADGDAPHVTDVARGGADLGTLDERSNVAQFGISLGEALELGVAFQAADSKDKLGGSAFGGAIDYGNYSPTSDAGVSQAGLGNLGLKANFKSDLVNVGVVIISAAEASDADLGSADNKYEATASGFGLGVGLNLGAIKPYFNLWSPNTTSKDNTAKDETASTATQLGVGLALGESSGVALSIVNRTSTHTDTPTGGTKTEDKTEVATTEIGYNTSLGGASFSAAYVSDSIKTTPGDGNNTEDIAVSWIKVRLQYGF